MWRDANVEQQSRYYSFYWVVLVAPAFGRGLVLGWFYRPSFAQWR